MVCTPDYRDMPEPVYTVTDYYDGIADCASDA